MSYGLILTAAILITPLRLGEILQMAGEWPYGWGRLMAWVAQTPGGAPLGYLVQLPFTWLAHESRLILRLPSLFFALGSCCLFGVLARQIPLKHSTLALVAFLLTPVHFFVAYQGRPFEQGVFLLLLATVLFFRLVSGPSVWLAALYGLVLTAGIYTDPGCYLPAAGYAVFLLGFVNGAAERRALWFALPATVLPALLYAPFFSWATPQRDVQWLSERFPAYSDPLIAIQALQSLIPGRWSAELGIALAVLLAAGLALAAASAFPLGFHPPGTPPPPPAVLRRRISLFCLTGGAVVTIATQVSINIWNNTPFAPANLLWAVPSLIILFFGALEWAGKLAALNRVPLLTPVLAGLLFALTLPADADYLVHRPGDIRALAALVKPELTEDSCLVFVSERLSKFFFILFEPDLEKAECENFFHKRVVLASHPFVRPDQQSDAEGYFKGLNFVEKKRQRASGGVIITLDQEH